MKAISKVLVELEDGSIGWQCPGCETLHRIFVNKAGSWTWDKSVDSPTFSPSALTRWTDGREEHSINHVCHCFVKAGMIQFLGDCTHKLAGQTVPIPEHGIV